MRTRCISKSWPSFFVRSGEAGSCFVDLGDFKNVSPPGDRGFIEFHGTRAESAGVQLRRELIGLGLMQDGPGAPAGNRNAGAENREKTAKIEAEAKRVVTEVVAGGKKRLAAQEVLPVTRERVRKARLPRSVKAIDFNPPKAQAIGVPEMKVQAAIDRLVESTKALDSTLAPKKTLTTTTKLVDGKLITSTKRPGGFPVEHPVGTKVEFHEATAAEVKRSHHKKPVAIIGATNDAAGLLPPDPKATFHPIAAKRSHHKKKVA